MALQIIGANSIGTGVQFFLTSNDQIIVSPGVTVGSTDLVAILGTASGNYANIQGMVSGAVSGVQLGGNAFTDMNNALLVGATGYVAGFQNGASFAGSNATVENHGTIWSAMNGLSLTGWSPATDTTVENDGLIEGSVAIRRFGAEAIHVENAGLLKGSDWAYYADDPTAKDEIINNGRIDGKIYLAGGNDVYDGHAGTLDGSVVAGDGDDALAGGTDNDAFFGNAGNDILRGNGGSDALDGGVGADKMFGGSGGDTYYVDNAGDIVDETGGSGVDTVISTVNFNLLNTARVVGALENLVLTGTATIGTGNALANSLSANLLHPSTLNGLAGNDTLLGLSAADTLNGGAGRDTLTGGAGADKFVFNSGLVAANRDVVTDFTHGLDKLALENAIFKALGAAGALTSAYFYGGALAHDANDRIIYNKATGALFYDSDGIGGHAQIQFATLANKPPLSASDFAVI